MNYVFYKIFIFLIVCGFVFGQEDKVVAKVGSYRIYESEFKDKFDFTAHPKLLNKSDQEAAKQEFLKQLIAEKLLSLDAQEKGYNNSEQLNNILSPLEKTFIRDALYKLEIKDKVEVTQKQIKQGLDRIKQVFKLKFIFSKNEDEIKTIYQQLKTFANFDSLLLTRYEFKDQVEPREVTFGTMDKEIEDEVYKLKPGEFTKPVKSGDAYYILKVIEVFENKNLKDVENTLEDVKRIIETRIEQKKYLDYYHNFFAKYKVTADKEIFEQLIKIFVPRFNEKYIIQNQENKNDRIYLRGAEVSSVLFLMDEEFLNNKFIMFEKKSIETKSFINQLSLDGFFVQDVSEKSIRASLSSYIRKFIEDELLAVEGSKKGLDKSEIVKKDIGMWKDYYLSQMQMTNILDSININDNELLSIYSMNDWSETSPQLVNIVEILTNNLDDVETILNELNKGKDITELASKYTIRDSVKNKSGEFGFFPITKYGELGRIAARMKIGEIYGPIKLDEGYSIFKLIDKKIDTTNYTKSFDEVKKDLKMQLTFSRFENSVNQYNAKLADKFGVEINEDVLKSIKNIFLDLVIVRKMGFGGEIFAVPYTQQYSGWYEIWQKNKNLIQ